MNWRIATAVYLLVYAALTWADFVTTNLGVTTGAGVEVNEVVVDRDSGGLSFGFFALQAVVGGVCALVFAWGYREIPTLPSHSSHHSSLAVLGGWAEGPGVPALRHLLGALTILGMKAVVPVSNLSVIYLGWSFPGAFRHALGGESAPAPIVLTLCVLTASAIGFMAAIPATRFLIGWARHRLPKAPSAVVP
jgi:hypothetical protein